MRKIFLFLAIVLVFVPLSQGQDEEKIEELFKNAIQAMGGDAYLKVTDTSSKGQRFYFNSQGENSGLVKFSDYTRLPDKSRYEEGNRKNDLDITVFDLKNNVGWRLEGQKAVRDATPEEMKDSRDSVKHSLDGIFRFRYRNPENKLFYLGPGDGHDVTLEMVKIIDSDNDDVTVYFDRISKLPVKVEYRILSKMGLRQRLVDEFSQWHVFQGVNTPLRTDSYINGRRFLQHFITELTYNNNLPDSLFTKPVRLK
jgi:hypothetical protein